MPLVKTLSPFARSSRGAEKWVLSVVSARRLSTKPSRKSSVRSKRSPWYTVPFFSVSVAWPVASSRLVVLS